ncbi:gamma-glutamyltranspeptidase [Roseobacter sp. AzwK-3b]|uniref:gamma-glutamyltransferase n=1 Tax=Roseobacter sp. AzwK-3b TaxID=351016 RepID=UPI0001569838|nr:gamma-glutamyltransferase [Roseobacter sp. AzwK-3b]EDM72164.1 gamma-glutamyltranspeptidase [Roseobacter sp. AzwK-3b]
MRLLAIGLILFVFSGAALAQQAADAVAPEGEGAGRVAATPELEAAQATRDVGRPAEARDWMIAAANPLAVGAGARVLRAGGTAADAMVAVQAVLGLVEPQSSGLGGGAFLVWQDGETGEITTLDGRETAPLAANPRLFQDKNGEPLDFYDAVVGGLSVGVPGTPALMQEAHERWGRSDWAGLFDEAIQLSEEGFEVSPRLAGMVALDALRLSRFEATREYFLSDNSLLEVGEVLRNPAYADTLRTLAQEGAGAFYAGDIARDIVAAVQGAEGNPGRLSEVDLAIYQVRERAAVCVPYRVWEVCGMGPPSSGGLTVGQILGLLEPFDLAAMGPKSAQAWRLIGDASRLAFADRGRYMADEDFVPVPVKGLIAKEYLEERSQLLQGDDALPEVAPGRPEFDHSLNLADDISIEFPSTTHISITDRYGNALSMTSTIENAFGSRVMVRGFLLNNELTDFSFRSHEEGVPIANRVEPGKRPRSSMAPTIVLKDGAPVMIVGSPGGSRIIGYVVKAIIAHLDWKMDVQQAVSMPNMVNRFGVFDLEAGTWAADLAPDLEALGYEVRIAPMVSGLHAISLGEGVRGGADPRREGIALGD